MTEIIPRKWNKCLYLRLFIPALLLTISSIVHSQTLSLVIGRVSNSGHEPLAGVTVTIKGTAKATATNEQGQFELKNVKTMLYCCLPA